MPETKQVPPLMLRDARLLFRNFAGAEKTLNSAGDRNFNVIIDPDLAQKLIAEGWRIKQLKPREEGEEGDYILKVNVNYGKGRPPRCVLVTSQGRTDLGADEVQMLDFLDLEKVDLTINGYWSDMAGGGFSGFLKTLFATVREDELEKEYAAIPDANVKAEDIAPWDREEAAV